MVTDTQRIRHLAWEGCVNARDLGGYAVGDGRETRWGAIIRSDNPWHLTAAGEAAVVDYGVRQIVDLRMPDEAAQWPNPFAESGTHGIAYAHVSFLDPAVPDSGIDRLADEYKHMLDRHSGQVTAIMRVIAHAPEGGVLIHCAAGKDRTGLISALLLELAGVSREVIGADYALSAECLRERNVEWLENGPGEREERERALAKYIPRAEVMQEVLEYLDERYGGTERYLLELGLRPDEIGRLRERLLVHSGSIVAVE